MCKIDPMFLQKQRALEDAKKATDPVVADYSAYQYV